MATYCPHCNRKLSVSLQTIGNASEKTYAATGIQWTGVDAASLERIPSPPKPQRLPGYRETPVRAPTLEADVFVPLAQSLIPGTCACILVGLGWLEFGWGKPMLAIASSFTGATGLWWLKTRVEFKKLLWQIEEWTGLDFNQDNQVGEPQAPDRPVVVEVWSNGGYKKRHSGLSERQVEKVALAVFQDGAKFSRRELCEGYRCFPADKYQNLVEIWVGLGLLERKGTHDNAPVSLTKEGLDFLGRYYDPPAPMEIG